MGVAKPMFELTVNFESVHNSKIKNPLALQKQQPEAAKKQQQGSPSSEDKKEEEEEEVQGISDSKGEKNAVGNRDMNANATAVA